MSKLLNDIRNLMRVRHYSYQTEKTYLHWIRQYIFFHQIRHPAEMGPAEVQAFLTYLAVGKNVAASTQNQALAALLFLYREVLQTNLPWLDKFTPAKKHAYVPVVLTKEEVTHLTHKKKNKPPRHKGTMILWPAFRRVEKFQLCFYFSLSKRKICVKRRPLFKKQTRF